MPYNVLFLCTGNSARSIMAEALLNYWGQGRFRAFSAGSQPKGQVHPLTLETLERATCRRSGAAQQELERVLRTGRARSWTSSSRCAATRPRSSVPYWPGQPMTAHWGIDDPAAVEGTQEEQARAFQRALRELDARIKLFINLPFEKLDKMALQQRLRQIGDSTADANETAAGSSTSGLASR